MMNVYTQYFQKSKVFLYPLLKLKKGSEFVPADTFICWDQIYSVNDYKFICVYHSERSKKFINFEFKNLKEHKLLENIIELPDNKNVYIFDFKKYRFDYDKFIEGKYSQFSIDTKNSISNFFGTVGKLSDYIQSFLDPEDYHESYAKALEVDIETIQNVYEVCSIPNLEKETLVSEFPPEVELLKNKYLSLD